MYGMKKKKKMNKGGKSFPDLTGDGKVTQADVLKGRGVKLKKKMMDGGTVNQQSVNENINPYGRPADTSLI